MTHTSTPQNTQTLLSSERGFVAELKPAQGLTILQTLTLPPCAPPGVPERATTAAPAATGTPAEEQAPTTTAMSSSVATADTGHAQPTVPGLDTTTSGTPSSPTATQTSHAAQQPSATHSAEANLSHRHPGCPPRTKQLLAHHLRYLIDIISGRRPVDNLLRLPMGNRLRATLRTAARADKIKGASLRSFHPNPAATRDCVDFVGTIEIAGRVRAFSGRFLSAKNPSKWKLDSFHLV